MFPVADSWVPTEEWDNGGAFDWCGHPDEFEEWEDRAACDSSGKEIRLPVFECLCAEAGGKQCDMDADTDGTALCPTGCNVTVASPPYEDTMMPIIDRITVLEQVSGCHDPSAMGGGDEFVAATMESVPRLTSSPCFHHHPYGLLSETHIQIVLNAICGGRVEARAVQGREPTESARRSHIS